jgi:hypothetical protein
MHEPCSCDTFSLLVFFLAYKARVGSSARNVNYAIRCSITKPYIKASRCIPVLVSILRVNFTRSVVLMEINICFYSKIVIRPTLLQTYEILLPCSALKKKLANTTN